MKNIYRIFLALITLGTFVACDYDDDLAPPSYASFGKNTVNLPVNEDSSNSFDVTVYTGNITGSDRTVTIEVDEASTLNAAAYELPQTVTIPANSNEATFTVNVTDTNLNNAGDTLILSLREEDGLSTGAPLRVNIARICEFELTSANLNNSGWFGAEFPVEIEAGASANQYVIKDLFADGTDITFTVNADHTITVPTQHAWFHEAQYGQASVTGRPGSKVEPCIGKFTLVLQHTVAAGSFGTFSEVFTVGAGTPDEGDGEEDEEDEEDTEG